MHKLYLLFVCSMIFLSSCVTVVRTPEQLKKTAASFDFNFSYKKDDVESCLIPQLDKLKPFTFPANDTRVPSVRKLGPVIQIIAVDETVTLYVVEIQSSTSGTKGKAWVNSAAYEKVIIPQLKETIYRCKGSLL